MLKKPGSLLVDQKSEIIPASKIYHNIFFYEYKLKLCIKIKVMVSFRHMLKKCIIIFSMFIYTFLDIFRLSAIYLQSLHGKQ